MQATRWTLLGVTMAAFCCGQSRGREDAMGTAADKHGGTHPVRIAYDFENGTDPVRFWTSYNHPYTIHTKEVASQKAHGGARAFRLDVTLGATGRFLWRIPLNPPIPAEGDLKLSAFMMLGQETSATATLGASFALPPTEHTGCTYWGSHVNTTGGDWKEITADLVKQGRARAHTVTRHFNWGVEADDVGVLLESVIIDVRGKKNQRVDIYVDDITVEGNVPHRTAYDKTVAQRYTRAAERFDQKIGAWKKALEKAKADVAELTHLSDPAEEMRAEVLQRIDDTQNSVRAVEEAGEIRQGSQADIDAFVSRLPRIPETIRRVAVATRNGRTRTLVSVTPPVSADMVLPDTRFILGATFGDVSLSACRGEYEPASIVVTPTTDLKALTVEVGQLVSENAVISPEHVVVRAVKCWYQAGTAWHGIRQDKSKRILTPELLLNNDKLVVVDHEKKENYLNLTFPDDTKTVWISDPADVRRAKNLPVENFPVKDAANLQPVDIPSGTNKQFWITVHVPEKAVPGDYHGDIVLKTPAGIVDTVTLRLRVLPFDLRPPYYTSSMDYHGRPVDGKGTIGSWLKSWTQFRNELANMVAHGLQNCQHYGISEKILPQVLKVREDVGMDNRTLYLKGTVKIGTAGGGLHGEAKAEKDALKRIEQDVKRVLDMVRPFGTETVYFYGIDEARGDRLAAQREAWKAVRRAGGKIFVAGYEENIDLMGDIQDMHVRAGRPSHEEAERWHALGHRIFCYANPQTGVENPVVYRRNFGVLLWQNDYDGAATNAYQHTFGATWNDFDHTVYRAHTIAYPTVDGVVDTIAWEGYREAVDDVRYITTLEHAVAANADTDDPPMKQAVEAAQEYLNDLKTRDDGVDVAGGDDLDAMRQTLIEHLLAIHHAE